MDQSFSIGFGKCQVRRCLNIKCLVNTRVLSLVASICRDHPKNCVCRFNVDAEFVLESHTETNKPLEIIQYWGMNWIRRMIKGTSTKTELPFLPRLAAWGTGRVIRTETLRKIQSLLIGFTGNVETWHFHVLMEFVQATESYFGYMMLYDILM